MRPRAKERNNEDVAGATSPDSLDRPANVSQVKASNRTASASAPQDDYSPILPPAVERWLHAQGAALGIALFLVVATLAVYVQTVTFEFVSYDDNTYLYENRHVKQGLTADSLAWAFTGVHSSNWHPLTTLSHILDWDLFGRWAGGHHLTNVLLHAASSVVLFLALRRLTGATWRSGMVAALFCLHPVHVESVAWVAERKDVLSGLFFGLTLWAYAAYAQTPFSWTRYLLVIVLYALGLLCKPMLVTMPFVLLLLDFWPLGRWRGVVAPSDRMLILEKLPLFALSGVSCTITYVVQRLAGAMEISVSLPMRVQTVVLGYGRYLAMLVWPFDLTVAYPRDLQFYAVAVLLMVAVLCAVSAAVLIFCRQRSRYLLVGWFWFLGMLVPVIGFVVVGDQSMADRYTYLPYTGLFVAVVWGAAEAVSYRKGARVAHRWCLCVAGIALLFFGVCSLRQASYWGDSEKLFRHALEVTQSNSLAHSILGETLWKSGVASEKNEALSHYNEALRISPNNCVPHNDMGTVFADHAQWKEAANEFSIAIKLRPSFAPAHSNLAYSLGAMGKILEAEYSAREALRLAPDSANAESILGGALAAQGKHQEAVSHFQRALEFDPGRYTDHLSLAISLFALQQFDEGIAECKKAIESNRDDVDACHELAKMYHRLGRLQEAFDEWREVVARQPSNAAAAKGLGVVLVKGGHGAEAIPYLKLSLAVAPQDLEAREYLVFAHLAASQTQDAMADFLAVLQQDRKDQNVLNGLAKMVESKPNDVYVRSFRAYALIATKQLAAGIAEFRAIIEIDAKNLDALNSLAWIEATHPDAKMRNGKEAVAFAEKAAKLRPEDAQTLDTLAAAYAEAGRFKDAVETANEAKQAADKAKDKLLGGGIAARQKLYEAGKPFRDETLPK
jgi:tetratricopeptide (TPR) repeat protein